MLEAIGDGLRDSISWTQIVLIFVSSFVMTLVTFAVLVWREGRRDRS